MSQSNRRDFLRGALAAASAGTTLNLFPPAIQKALAIPARSCTRTLIERGVDSFSDPALGGEAQGTQWPPPDELA